MAKKLTEITPEELIQIVKSPLTNAEISRELGVTKSTIRYVRHVYQTSIIGWDSLVQRMWKRLEENNRTGDYRIITFEQFKREIKAKRDASK